MTFIKKYFKVILCFMAFALVSFAFAFAPTYTALAAKQEISNASTYALKITGVKIKDVDLSDKEAKLEIPLVDISTFAGKTSGENLTLTVRVYDPSMKVHEFTAGTNENADYFDKKASSIVVKNPSSGTYHVIYIIKDATSAENVKTYASAPYSVTVSNARYEFVEKILDKDGYKILLADTLAQNSTKAIKLPVAKVKNISDKDGVNAFNISSAEVDAGEATVKLTRDNGTVVELKKSATVNTDNEFFVCDNEYYFVPKTVGQYKLVYSYNKGDNQPQETIAFEVVESNKFNAPSTEELKLSKPSISGIVLGETGLKLPDVVMSSKAESSIAHNTVITVQHGKYFQTLVNTFTIDMTLDKFVDEEGNHPTSWSELKGAYKFHYKAFDGTNEEDSYRVATYISDDITVQNTKLPTITMSYDYDAEETDIDAAGNLKVAPKLDKEVQFGTTMGYDEIVVPAVYASDPVSSFEDFNFVRSIQKDGDSVIYYVDNVNKDGALKITEKDDGTFTFATGWNFALVSSDVAFVDDMSEVTGSDYDGKYIVFVKDNTFTFKGKFKSADSSLDTTVTDWKQKLGEWDGVGRIKTNKAQAFKFDYDAEVVNAGNYDGNYKINYYAIIKNDVKNNTSTTKSYSITVDENATFTRKNKKNPIVSFDDNTMIPNEIVDTDTISTKVISNDSTDEKLKTILLYTYTKPTDLSTKVNAVLSLDAVKNNKKSHAFDTPEFFAELKSRLSNSLYIVDEDSTTAGLYEFKLQDVGENKKVYIVAMSMNNDGIVGYSAVETVDIKTVTADDVAPTIESVKIETVNNGMYSFVEEGSKHLINNDYTIVNNGETIYLPTVTFDDNIDNYLSVTAKYYVLNDDITDVTPDDYMGVNLERVADNTLSGSITPTENVEGQYYVVYTAMDDAGNATVMYFTFKVADRTTIDAKINAGMVDKNLKESYFEMAGKTINTRTEVQIDFKGIVENSKGVDITSEIPDENKVFEITAIDGKLDCEQIGKYSYKFNSIGTYQVKFTATYDPDGDEGPATTKTATEIIIVNVTDYQDAEWDEENLVERIGEKPANGENYGFFENTDEISLPTLTASRGSKTLYVAANVTGPGITDDEGKNVTSFTPEKKGTYTVTYKAYMSQEDMEKETNAVGKTQTYTIKVGDDERPTLGLSNRNALEQSIVLEGSVIDYKLMISNDCKIQLAIINNGKTTTIDTGFSMTDIDSKGNANPLNKSNIASINIKAENGGEYTTDSSSSSSLKYFKLNKTGKYTVTIKVNDGRGNDKELSYSFNVINKTTAEKDKVDSNVGIILIIVSSILLVGIVVFFLIYSKRGKKRSNKSNKTSKEVTSAETKTEKSDDKVENESQEAEVEDISDAKSGEVE